jgi:hypothetical protein
VFCFGQKVYVSCDDPKPKGSIEKKIVELNYSVIDDSSKADIIARFVYQKAKSAMSFKVKPNIYASILFYDGKNNELSKTDQVGGLTGVWVGYNPRVDAAWKILTRDFETKLKEAVDKVSSTAAKENTQISIRSKADELTKLKKLLDDGALSKEEFEAEKKKILDSK